MRPEPAHAWDPNPTRKPESYPTESDPGARKSKPRTRPFTGGYYWLPAPAPEGIIWSVITCRDLGCDADAGHDAALWPRLMAPLAEAWGKDAQALKRRLALSYTGLPRGRVTRPEKTFLVLHGEDSPPSGWREMIIASFRLTGRTVRFLFDEHETELLGHLRAVEAALGSRLIGGKT